MPRIPAGELLATSPAGIRESHPQSIPRASPGAFRAHRCGWRTWLQPHLDVHQHMRGRRNGLACPAIRLALKALVEIFPAVPRVIVNGLRGVARSRDADDQRLVAGNLDRRRRHILTPKHDRLRSRRNRGHGDLLRCRFASQRASRHSSRNQRQNNQPERPRLRQNCRLRDAVQSLLAHPFSYGAAMRPIARRCWNFHSPFIFT